MLVYPLQADARELLRDPQDRPEWQCAAVRVQYGRGELESLRSLLDAVAEPRHARGLRHPLGALLALVKLSGRSGGRAAETFSKALPQEDLRALGCRFNASRKCYEAPSDTTFQRVLAQVEPGSLERVIQRWTQPRCPRPRALAGDGKRIRGAHKLGPQGGRYETLTLVDHDSGMPVASRSYYEQGGEQAALRGLPEEYPLEGVTVTLDAGHASDELETALVEQHGADSMLGAKGNCSATYVALRGLDWSAAEARRASHTWTHEHGRWEWRKLEVLPLQPGQVPFRHARQALRVTHRRREKWDGEETVEILYGLTSWPRARAGARPAVYP